MSKESDIKLLNNVSIYDFIEKYKEALIEDIRIIKVKIEHDIKLDAREQNLLEEMRFQQRLNGDYDWFKNNPEEFLKLIKGAYIFTGSAKELAILHEKHKDFIRQNIDADIESYFLFKQNQNK